MAGYNNTSKDAALTAVGAAATYISLHTPDPGTTGTSEVSGGTYARVQTTWGTAAASSMTGSQVTINVPASTTITYWGVWSAASGGTYYEGGVLPSSQAYVSAGTYLHTPTLTATG